jgi:hypothetical protein
MSILRKDNSQEVIIEKPKNQVYDGFYKAAQKCGKIKGGSQAMGTILVKASGGTMSNTATVRISVSAVNENQTKVQLRAESLDGAIGFGSAGKTIDRLVDVAGGMIHGYEVHQPSVLSGLMKAGLLGVGVFLIMVILIAMQFL